MKFRNLVYDYNSQIKCIKLYKKICDVSSPYLTPLQAEVNFLCLPINTLEWIPYIIPNLKISNAQNPEKLKIPTSSKSRQTQNPEHSKSRLTQNPENSKSRLTQNPD